MNDQTDFLAQLIRHHDLIDRMTGSMRTLLHLVQQGSADPAELKNYLDFHQNFMVLFHHEREEVLFRALEEKGLSGKQGPLFLLREEHREMRQMIETLYTMISSVTDPEAVSKNVTTLSHWIWEHVDKENSVLFTEVPRHIPQDTRETDLKVYLEEEERFAPWLIRVERCTQRHPPMRPDIIRGPGCVQCRHFTVRCDGMEHEWWREEDWKNLHIRMGGD
ncbi:MAG TPA: hemerythrin domain-containing protein [Thermoanaerobaculia bacterium]|nr:hemerythrin domain-containing protein [Thermoanaerobaculia bacterium]HUM29294.1 hemerythrin domain-containing protein [Thermoanaerobaculia bacterium]HXK67748.1 hemerythrin domain-containing protein [Thermoanaerobaculia bacterium]